LHDATDQKIIKIKNKKTRKRYRPGAAFFTAGCNKQVFSLNLEKKNRLSSMHSNSAKMTTRKATLITSKSQFHQTFAKKIVIKSLNLEMVAETDLSGH